MNYNNSVSLEGSILSVGDLVSICDIGHLVGDNELENIGNCGDLWMFEMLGIDLDDADSFCRGITPGVWIDFGDDKVCFDTLESLTLVVLVLMRLSEEKGYGDE